jgi:hypothetical protein
MSRIVLAALAATLLLLPATAGAQSVRHLHGVVASEDAFRSFVTVSSARRDHVLRVEHAAFQRIRVGMRVELRGKTLRSEGANARVLSRNALRVRTEPRAGALQADDDEIEVKGTLTSLSPLTVLNNGRSFTCALPAGQLLSGFAVGDFVEMTCDLRAGAFVLRVLKHEDDDEANEDDDENRGPGNAEDDDGDTDNSGPGNADDDDDNSGPGNGDDDDDDDDGGNRGRGGGDDDD